MTNYTHQDWKDFKKAAKLNNAQVSEIIGTTEQNVKMQTRPDKRLASWAKAMIWVWKNGISINDVKQ